MIEEPTLLDDLRSMRDDLCEPGWSGTFALAVIVLVAAWLVICTADAYLT